MKLMTQQALSLVRVGNHRGILIVTASLLCLLYSTRGAPPYSYSHCTSSTVQGRGPAWPTGSPSHAGFGSGMAM